MLYKFFIAALFASVALAAPNPAVTPRPMSSSSVSSSSASASSASSSSSAPPSCPTSFEIHPNGVNNKCLDVKGNIRANGTPVQIFDCNGTGAQKWLINASNTKVQLAGTNFCLDAGSNPANFVGMKIWTCFDNLAAQAWFYTQDKRIALTGKGQCLDLPNGDLTNGNQIQTFQCTDFNTNQIWTTTPA